MNLNGHFCMSGSGNAKTPRFQCAYHFLQRILAVFDGFFNGSAVRNAMIKVWIADQIAPAILFTQFAYLETVIIQIWHRLTLYKLNKELNVYRLDWPFSRNRQRAPVSTDKYDVTGSVLSPFNAVVFCHRFKAFNSPITRILAHPGQYLIRLTHTPSVDHPLQGSKQENHDRRTKNNGTDLTLQGADHSRQLSRHRTGDTHPGSSGGRIRTPGSRSVYSRLGEFTLHTNKGVTQ